MIVYLTLNALTADVLNDRIDAPSPTLVAVDLLSAIVNVVFDMSFGPDSVPSVLVTASAQSAASSPQPGDVPCTGYS